MSPRKEEIIGSILEGIKSSGREPICPTDSKNFSDPGRQVKEYYRTQISRAVGVAKKDAGDNWGESGQTGTVQRDYTHDQTNRILDVLDDEIKNNKGRGANLRKSGLTHKSIERARASLFGHEEKQ